MIKQYLFLFIVLTTLNFSIQASDQAEKKKEDFCQKINSTFKQNKWKRIICKAERWQTYGYSSQGHPLLFQEFGFENQDKNVPINLIFCSVHGDESNGAYACFHLVRDILFDHPDTLKKMKLVIAPIVNPEGFFKHTRTNGNGVDINRNLPTSDWDQKAKELWNKFKNDPNKFPGEKSNSEPETKFQVGRIEKYHPDKIISIHAPYGFIDLDGPGDTKYYNFLKINKRARLVALEMQASSKRVLKFVDFRFFPGSLGNYAGFERKIPTYTIEFPSTQISKADYYWSIVRVPLLKALTTKIQ